MIIQKNQNSIFRKEISKNALNVLYKLNNAGYKAYLVGGCVRDLLLGKKPKDFDVATNATPEQIRKLFHNCRLIGRRFRLAHIIFNHEIIEVATFRGHIQSLKFKKNINKSNVSNNEKNTLNDNIFGSIEEDAQRRDFSVNSLYYNIIDFTIIDYNGGLKDLYDGIIRLLGHPETRYREDIVRILRAIRFSAKLNMTINNETAEPISRLAPLLKYVPPARLFEESLKLLQTGHGKITYLLLCKHQVFQRLFPLISCNFTEHGNSNTERMIIRVLVKTDQRLRKNMHVNPAFLFAAMLWYPLLNNTQKILAKTNSISYMDAFSKAINSILKKQCHTLAIPKRLTNLMRDIWQFQIWLSHKQGKQNAYKLVKHSKFRAAYDLLVLRAEIENDVELIKLNHWWKNFQNDEFIKDNNNSNLIKDNNISLSFLSIT